MFGMELWFLLALISTLSGGIAGFVYKIASVNNLNSTLLASYSGLFSAIIILGMFVAEGNYYNLWHPMIFFAVLASSTFFVTQILKVEAMHYIDTAIFYPIYKVTGPLIAIVIGVLFFAENFTPIEWIGLFLSLLVPVLLITKAENIRQKDLVKGIWMVLVCSAAAAVSIAFTKEGTLITENILGFILVGEIFMVVTGVLVLISRFKKRATEVVITETNKLLLWLSVFLGGAHALGAYTIVFAFHHEGPLGIVYTINSLYILIPIVLSIIFYNEHWNARKVLAIILSIAALGLLR